MILMNLNGMHLLGENTGGDYKLNHILVIKVLQTSPAMVAHAPGSLSLPRIKLWRDFAVSPQLIWNRIKFERMTKIICSWRQTKTTKQQQHKQTK